MAKSFSTIKGFIEEDDLVTFGKHSGLRWLDVAATDPDYLIWCVGNLDHKFSYELIVSSIKSKYVLRKEAKERAEEFNKKLEKEVKQIHGSSWADWDDDIPF